MSIIGDTSPTDTWPQWEQNQTPYTINSIYDVAPSFLGDLQEWFAMNPLKAGAVPTDAAKVIQDSGMLSSSQATIDFPNIEAGYFALSIRYMLRGDAATQSTRLQMQFNGDAGANYHCTITRINGLASTPNPIINNVFTNHNVNSMSISEIPAASATQSVTAGSGLIEIPGYANPNFVTTAICKGVEELDWTLDGQVFDVLGAGNWNQLAAITRVTLQPASGNFVAGSQAVLYGL